MIRVLDEKFLSTGFVYLAQKSNLVKILIIRFSSIGDIVLTTPVARILKNQQQAEVHYLTKGRFKNLLVANPNIDKVWSFEEKLEEVLPALKAEKFDLIVDLHKNLRSMQVKMKLGVQSTSFDKLNFKKWLLVQLKIHRLPDKHIVDRYLETISHFGIQNDGKGLDYYFSKKEEAVASEVQRAFPNIQVDKPFIAFAIGAAHQTKRVPLHRCKEIAAGLSLPVILLGGPGEKEDGEVIAKDLPHIVNTCGHLSLDASAFLVKHAWKVISPDTGMMHIAAAFQKELVSIWGNTVLEFGMTPYYAAENPPAHALFEMKGLSCRPCSKIGYESCPKGHFNCMEQLPYPSIIEMLKKGAS
ncbi:MAG: glycosyltransferase family 9 protein [Saprospiraceae bacterium]|nr:glycosyltransferase family 9 protein [Saprospiraceae bacterium]